MQLEETSILDDIIVQQTVRRKKLLPIWIRIFTFLFLFAGALTPIILVVGLMGGTASLALFGLESNEPFSYVGIGIWSQFAFKGVAAFGLWMERDWAIDVAKVDAILSMIVVTAVKLVMPAFFESYSVSFPIELALLIPYFLHLRKIEASWAQGNCG